MMIPKPNKPTNLPSSNRPIGILPTMEKILEKLLLKRLYPILESQNTISDHQFGFRSLYSTVLQCHRVANVITSYFAPK